MKLNHYQYLSSVLLARFIYTNGSNTKEPGEGLGENEMTIHFLLIRFNLSILWMVVPKPKRQGWD